MSTQSTPPIPIPSPAKSSLSPNAPVFVPSPALLPSPSPPEVSSQPKQSKYRTGQGEHIYFSDFKAAKEFTVENKIDPTKVAVSGTFIYIPKDCRTKEDLTIRNFKQTHCPRVLYLITWRDGRMEYPNGYILPEDASHATKFGSDAARAASRIFDTQVGTSGWVFRQSEHYAYSVCMAYNIPFLIHHYCKVTHDEDEFQQVVAARYKPVALSSKSGKTEKTEKVIDSTRDPHESDDPFINEVFGCVGLPIFWEENPKKPNGLPKFFAYEGGCFSPHHYYAAREQLLVELLAKRVVTLKEVEKILDQANIWVYKSVAKTPRIDARSLLETQGVMSFLTLEDQKYSEEVLAALPKYSPVPKRSPSYPSPYAGPSGRRISSGSGPRKDPVFPQGSPIRMPQGSPGTPPFTSILRSSSAPTNPIPFPSPKLPKPKNWADEPVTPDTHGVQEAEVSDVSLFQLPPPEPTAQAVIQSDGRSLKDSFVTMSPIEDDSALEELAEEDVSYSLGRGYNRGRGQHRYNGDSSGRGRGRGRGGRGRGRGRGGRGRGRGTESSYTSTPHQEQQSNGVATHSEVGRALSSSSWRSAKKE